MNNYIFWSPSHAADIFRTDCDSLPQLLLAEFIHVASCSTVAGNIPDAMRDLCLQVADEVGSGGSGITCANGAELVRAYCVRSADYAATAAGVDEAGGDGALYELFDHPKRLDDQELYAAIIGARVGAHCVDGSKLFFVLKSEKTQYIV
jgi:hypothetical protein